MTKYLHHLFTDTLEHCHLKQSWSAIIASLFLQQQIAVHHVYLLKPLRIKIMCHWVAFHHLTLPQVTGMPKKKRPHLFFIINAIVKNPPQSVSLTVCSAHVKDAFYKGIHTTHEAPEHDLWVVTFGISVSTKIDHLTVMHWRSHWLRVPWRVSTTTGIFWVNLLFLPESRPALQLTHRCNVLWRAGFSLKAML